MPNEKKTPPPGSGSWQIPDGVKYLDTLRLDAFASAFECWYKDTKGTATKRARGRVWLVFLILRYTGARLNEVLSLDEANDININLKSIRLHAGDAWRDLQLPTTVMDEIAQFLAAPDSAKTKGKTFRLDQGHVRRKFQEVGLLAGIPKELANPATLRRSRAIELLRDDVPLKVVQAALGQSTANLSGSLLEFTDQEMQRILSKHLRKENAKRMSARNTFWGKVTRIVRGDIQAEVELATLGGYPVIAVITNRSLRSMELIEGSYGTAIVKAPWVALAKDQASPAYSARNKLSGRVTEIEKGHLNTEVTVELPDGVNVCSVITTQSLQSMRIAIGDKLWVMFEASAVILLAD